MNSTHIPARTTRRQFKIVLLGESTVGKTSIIQQLVHSKFDLAEQPTVGIDFLTKVVNIRGRECRLQLWDSAGQQKYMSLVGSYLRDADCALFVFDLNNSNSLQKLQKWIRLYVEINHKLGLAYICGNKSDLKKNINTHTLNHLINYYKLPYHTLSALTAHNLHEFFLLIAQALLNRQQQQKITRFMNLNNQDLQSQPTEGGMVDSRAVKLGPSEQKKTQSSCAC